MRKEISFWWDAEKRIRVAQAGQKHSLFYEAYRQALAGVAEIVRASIMHKSDYAYDIFFSSAGQDAHQNSAGSSDELRIACDSQYLYDYPSNIIVFSGERGAGKSSAMLTFVNSLKDEKGLLFQDEFLSGMVTCELPNVNAPAVKRMLQTSRFVDLAPIDPTTLENDGQILIVILARMFRLASTKWEREPSGLGRESSAKRLDQKNRLIQKFSTCYEHVRAIKRGGKSKPEYEGLDTLAELGDSSQLKVELYELVEELLGFCMPEAGSSSYLVLQIDDTDMNIKQAYALLEDVRRYLVIPRLIIVMAADLRHLIQVVESSLLKDYDNTLVSRHEYVEKITHQYVTKLFPQTRQIDLPALGAYFKEHTENITISYRTAPGKNILPDSVDTKFPDPQEQIFRLIYRKTGMVFLKQEHRLHPIVPCNMRLLAHFLSMLIQMEDVDDPDAEEPSFFLKTPDAVNTYETHGNKLRTRLQNIQRFRSYFVATWVTNSLSSKFAQMFKGLEQTDVADRIRYICAQLKKCTQDEEDKEDKDAGLIGDCYADMTAMCRDITEHSWNEDLKLLAFAFQTYCSLLAHTLALEELIDYYDEYAKRAQQAETIQQAQNRQETGSAHQEQDEPEKGSGEDSAEEDSRYGSNNTGLGCSFSKLHLLFGSRLFPYCHESKGKTVSLKMRPVGSDKTSSEERTLHVAWQASQPPSLSGLTHKARQCAALFYSMLGEYQPARSVQGIGLDLTRPITNCLYLGDKNGLTRFSSAIDGGEPMYVTSIGEDSWHSMGNSALSTVLNCDVQARIGSALSEKISDFDAGPADESSTSDLDYGTWISLIKGLYHMMKDSMGSSHPIKFLENMEFDGWLNPLIEVTLENPNDWNDIISKLRTPSAPQPSDQTGDASDKPEISESQPSDETGDASGTPETSESQPSDEAENASDTPETSESQPPAETGDASDTPETSKSEPLALESPIADEKTVSEDGQDVSRAGGAPSEEADSKPE